MRPLPDGFRFRPIRAQDDPTVARIIRTVMPEFGAAGAGSSIHDPEVDGMSTAYSVPRAAYFVVERGDGHVVGGGGIAPLAGADRGVCELRKMYCLEETRGQGIGTRLLEHCLAAARELGYRTCYLETLTGMDAAMHLYQKAGFRKLCGPMGATGHHGCNRYYALDLV